MSGLFPAAAWPQDVSQSEEGKKKKNSRSPSSSLLLTRAGVPSDSGKNLPQVFKKKGTASEDITLVMNPGALFQLEQRSIALFDRVRHKRPLMFQDIHHCDGAHRGARSAIFFVLGFQDA